MWSGEKPDYLWPEIRIGTSKAAKKLEEEGWAMEKPRRLRGIYFIDPEDGEYEETIKKREKEIGSSHGSGCALQDGDKKNA